MPAPGIAVGDGSSPQAPDAGQKAPFSRCRSAGTGSAARSRSRSYPAGRYKLGYPRSYRSSGSCSTPPWRAGCQSLRQRSTRPGTRASLCACVLLQGPDDPALRYIRCFQEESLSRHYHSWARASQPARDASRGSPKDNCAPRRGRWPDARAPPPPRGSRGSSGSGLQVPKESCQAPLVCSAQGQGKSSAFSPPQQPRASVIEKELCAARGTYPA